MQGHFREKICDCKEREERKLWAAEDGKDSWTLVGCAAHIEKSFSYTWYKKTSKSK